MRHLRHLRHLRHCAAILAPRRLGLASRDGYARNRRPPTLGDGYALASTTDQRQDGESSDGTTLDERSSLATLPPVARRTMPL